MENEERLIVVLENIEKSLSTIAADTKANKELREQNIAMFAELELKIQNLVDNPFGLED